MARRTVFTGLAALTVAGLVLAGCSSSPQATEVPTSTSTFAAPSTTSSSTPSPTPTPTTTSTPTSTKTSTTSKHTTTARPAPAKAVDPLTGGTLSDNPVVAVKIDNTAGGRPQYGVAKADVVYIEQVEGGLTRMMAMFHTQLPTEVGPVRSVRTTDVDLLQAYGKPILVFSGGAGGPLSKLASSPVVDASGVDGYWRSDAAPEPYNLHADLAKVVAAAGTQASKVRSVGFTFAVKDPRLAKAPKVNSIEVTMQAGYTGFTYDAGHTRYLVSNSGGPAVDPTGTQFTATNVLVQNVYDEPDGNYDSLGSPSFYTHTTGHGTFTLYRDGKAVTGKWYRDANDQATRFIDPTTHTPVSFRPGNTWVLLAPQTSQVSTG